MRIMLRAAIAGAAVFAGHAVAAQDSAAAPASAPLKITVSDKGPNGMSDLPMGVRRIPDSDIVVSGHQKGGALGLLFGVVGMAVQSSANTQAGERRTENIQDALRFDVAGKTSEMIAAIMAEAPFQGGYTLTAATDPAALSIVPFVVLTFVNETDVRPYIVLKTKPGEATGGEKPKTIKYFCCEGPALPLIGEDSLTANNGEKLKALLTSELDTAIRMMLLDRRQPFPRIDEARLDINGSLPFIGKPSKCRGRHQVPYNDYRLIEFRGGILVFGGVHAVEPGALEITPYVKKK